MTSTAVMTIASNNYLPYVNILMDSLKRTNPDYRRFLILADKVSPEINYGDDLFEIIEADQLGISKFRDMTLRYDVMEFNTAIKPFAIERLFKKHGIQNVIYLDPDICVYRKLHELDTLLAEGHSAVLTPHITRPLSDGKKPNDYHMLQAGVFNLGFIALHRDADADQFVRWWGEKLRTLCHAEPHKNLFTDQRWVDLAPCFIERLAVLRNTTYNVAYWNLAQRAVDRVSDKYLVDGKELAFFHFSGLDPKQQQSVSKHQDRLTWSDLGVLQKLFNEYREQLEGFGWGKSQRTPYFYDRLGSLAIKPIMRKLYSDLFPDAIPGIVSEEELIALCRAPTSAVQDGGSAISNLMYCTYRLRPDVQAAFPLHDPAGREGFTNWFRHAASAEYQLDSRLYAPEQQQATAPPESQPIVPPNAHHSPLYRQWRKARKWCLELGGLR
jgi:lipopolysaccharide biosynthesis glycosyltransferase